MDDNKVGKYFKKNLEDYSSSIDTEDLFDKIENRIDKKKNRFFLWFFVLFGLGIGAGMWYSLGVDSSFKKEIEAKTVVDGRNSTVNSSDKLNKEEKVSGSYNEEIDLGKTLAEGKTADLNNAKQSITYAKSERLRTDKMEQENLSRNSTLPGQSYKKGSGIGLKLNEASGKRESILKEEDSSMNISLFSDRNTSIYHNDAVESLSNSDFLSSEEKELDIEFLFSERIISLEVLDPQLLYTPIRFSGDFKDSILDLPLKNQSKYGISVEAGYASTIIRDELNDPGQIQWKNEVLDNRKIYCGYFAEVNLYKEFDAFYLLGGMGYRRVQDGFEIAQSSVSSYINDALIDIQYVDVNGEPIFARYGREVITTTQSSYKLVTNSTQYRAFLGLGKNFFLGKRLSLFSDIRMAYVLNDDFLEGRILSPIGELVSIRELIDDRNVFSGMVSMGASYRILQNTDIFIRSFYDRSFTDLSSTPTYSEYRDYYGISLGVRYRLSR